MATVYETINYLADHTFVAGSSWRINFTTFESDDITELDITGGSTSYRIAPLGDNTNTVINLTGVIDDALLGEWHVLLESSDTTGMIGVFKGQPRVVAYNGNVYIPGQGDVTIIAENTL